MAQSGLEALELLRSRFFNRTDVVAIQTSAGKPCPARPHDFLRALRGHMRGPRSDTSSFILYAGRGVCTVTGAYRLGTYASDASGRTRWACVDIDGANHKKCVSRPFTLAREVCDEGILNVLVAGMELMCGCFLISQSYFLTFAEKSAELFRYVLTNIIVPTTP